MIIMFGLKKIFKSRRKNADEYRKQIEENLHEIGVWTKEFNESNLQIYEKLLSFEEHIDPSERGDKRKELIQRKIEEIKERRASLDQRDKSYQIILKEYLAS